MSWIWLMPRVHRWVGTQIIFRYLQKQARGSNMRSRPYLVLWISLLTGFSQILQIRGPRCLHLRSENFPSNYNLAIEMPDVHTIVNVLGELHSCSSDRQTADCSQKDMWTKVAYIVRFTALSFLCRSSIYRLVFPLLNGKEGYQQLIYTVGVWQEFFDPKHETFGRCLDQDRQLLEHGVSCCNASWVR